MPMSRRNPRIAIPLPTRDDAAYNLQNWQAYADAILASGGSPVQVSLTLSPAELGALSRGCAGVLLPGSPADVDPALYGQPRKAATNAADPAREQTDRVLLEQAERTGSPVLGVCFGMQMLNVWRGGTLIQDLSPVPVNHAAARGVAVAHTTSVLKNSLLAGIVAPDECQQGKLPVNSSHHQAVGIAGTGLVVTGRCPQDDVVEAIESTEASRFLVGVQWHPERTFQQSATSQALFRTLVARAAEVANGDL